MSPKRYLGAFRALLLIAGLGTLCYGVYFGGGIPEPPPNADSLPTGFGVMIGLLILSAGAVLTHVGYALPAGTGRFRFGPLADRSAALRAAVLTVAFVAAVALLTLLGVLIPDSAPRVVSSTYAFSWIAAVAGTVTGLALTVVLVVGTACWRLVRGEPLLGGAADPPAPTDSDG